jgi:uncharacterized RDD family membrane protein YckC
MGLVAPPKSAGTLARTRGVLLIIAIIAVVLAIGYGLAYVILLGPGEPSVGVRVFWAFVIVVVALGALAFFGRRRQKAALAKRSEMMAARRG